MATKLQELRGQLQQRQDALAEILQQAGPDRDFSKVTAVEGDTKAKVEHLQAIDREMNDLQDQIVTEESIDGIASRSAALSELKPHPGHQAASRQELVQAREQEHQTLGQMFVESKALTGYRGGVGPVAHFEVNPMATLLDSANTSSSWAPQTARIGRFVDYALRAPRVVDLIPTVPMSSAAIEYMEETTFTNAAVEVTEGSAKPEAALDFTLRTETARKIAVWIPVTDEQLADTAALRAIIENRLETMVKLRLDSQILVGDGVAPNLAGIEDNSRTGLQTQAKGGDPTPDAFYKAIQLIRSVAFSEPNGIVVHPDDWTPIRLLSTADGIYIWGPPMDAGPERMWGLPVVVTTAQTEDTGLVGDFRQAALYLRQGIDVQVSNQHDDYFVRNLLAIRAEMRAALAVYRPAAFCTVTGI
jgi:HK97 family phage major capsid protein